MKEKLEVIREALNFYESNYEEVIYENEGKTYREIEATDNLVFDEGKTAKKAITLLDSLIAELDSEELVERVKTNISNAKLYADGDWDKLEFFLTRDEITAAAQAAINAIKGITATTNRE